MWRSRQRAGIAPRTLRSDFGTRTFDCSRCRERAGLFVLLAGARFFSLACMNSDRFRSSADQRQIVRPESLHCPEAFFRRIAETGRPEVIGLISADERKQGFLGIRHRRSPLPCRTKELRALIGAASAGAPPTAEPGYTAKRGLSVHVFRIRNKNQILLLGPLFCDTLPGHELTFHSYDRTNRDQMPRRRASTAPMAHRTRLYSARNG